MKMTEEQKKQRQEESQKRQKKIAELAKKIQDTFPQFTMDELRVMFPELFP